MDPFTENPRPGEACPCCDHLTLERRGHYDICPVCFWEDDPAVEWDGPDAHSSPNQQTLNDARANFARYGACTEGSKRFVREPKPWERPTD